MSRKFFGTDGIRGIANQALTPELAFSLGQGAGRWLIERNVERRVVLGRDTRRSGPMLGASLAAGFGSVGVDVDVLGIVPTPTVVHAARTGPYGMGAIISASHNPAPDNGIKLVGHDGRKLLDDDELEIERLLEAAIVDRPVGSEIGYVQSTQVPIDHYLDFLEGLCPNRLDGLKVAVDAANGAAYQLAPAILARLGAQVVVVGVSPDGMNINAEGGATKPSVIQDQTLANRCAIGVAFDGDADRAVFSDEKGRLINGDCTIALWAKHHQIEPRTVVGTIMSNGGYGAYLAANGILLERTPVGDKYVAQKLQETGAKVGGEQSGHIIFPDHQPSGDGLLTMLEVLKVLHDSGCKASDFVDAYANWPQILINVEVADRKTWDQSDEVRGALKRASEDLAGSGRINVRPSGTQPMIRIMVEANDQGLRDRVANDVLTALSEHANGKVYSKVDLTHALGD